MQWWTKWGGKKPTKCDETKTKEGKKINDKACLDKTRQDNYKKGLR